MHADIEIKLTLDDTKYGLKYGFSLYKGILVELDMDHDRRIFTFISKLPSNVRQELLYAFESEGCLVLMWKHAVPDGYTEYDEGIEVEGDWWTFSESYAIGSDRHKAYVSHKKKIAVPGLRLISNEGEIDLF